MPDYSLVRFESVYFTDTGLVDGQPCRVEVAGLDDLGGAHRGSTVQSADGTPYTFLVPNTGQGVILEIRPLVITTTVLDDIREIIDTATSDEETFVVEITGDLGDYEVNVQPLLPKPLEFTGEFEDGNIFGVVLRVIVESFV